MIYLDYAAATPMDKKVLKVMEPYFSDKFYNPSAPYSMARDVRADYEEAKHTIASQIGAKQTEIIMTAGATESINLAFDVPRVKKSKILISGIEHQAVIAAATRETLFTRVGIIKNDNTGRIDLADLEQQLSDETILVSVGYANNEIGTIQDIQKISELIAKARADRLNRGIKTPLYFHTDASQAVGLLDINVARLGVDMMTLNAGKCYGPKQVGLLYIRTGTKLTPLIVGGGQEMGLRSGTENVAGTIGFAKALEIAEKKRKNEVKRQGEIRQNLHKFLKEEFPSIVINGSKKHCLPGLINFSIPGLDAERAVYALDQKGIYVATGSACAANKGLRSHVLKAIGLSDDLADGSLRVSFGRDTTKEQVDEFKTILSEVIRNELKLS
ncbi:cysteine desulfurase [Ruminococcaceae bacterium OttesenSCG-928-A11]|nr:cysteine desulfurase [Ruminococcaceae bacterium OttesenSCG-928-A11]